MAAMAMDWSGDAILQLVDAYRDRPMLWDDTHKFYKIVNRNNEAWAELAQMFGSDVLQVKRKINSLLASFRREHHKVRLREGLNETGKCCSSWFAYDSFSFLYDKYKPRSMSSRTVIESSNDLPREEHEENIGNYHGIIKVENNISEDHEEENNVDEYEEEDERFEDTSFTDEAEENPKTPLVLLPSQKTVRPKRKRAHGDTLTLVKAFKIFQAVSEKQRGEYDIFGEYVACKLRKMDHRTRCIVEHAINNVLFDAAMGRYDNMEYARASTLGLLPQDSQPGPSSSTDPQQ